MYANISLSENRQDKTAIKLQRVSATAVVSFKHNGSRTGLDRLYQQGSAKVRFPNTCGAQLEAVLINTAGGLTGGDQLSWDLRVGENAEVVVSTQACEKAYGSADGVARIKTQIHLDAGSNLHWLPQETILYDKSALSRTFDVTMEVGSTLLAIESIVLGRMAMGETVKHCVYKDRWRIRQGDKLLFADNVSLTGKSDSIVTTNKCKAFTSFLYVGVLDEERLQATVRKLRAVCPVMTAGFSAHGGKITGRILASDKYHLRKALVPILKTLRGSDLPRVWRS